MKPLAASLLAALLAPALSAAGTAFDLRAAIATAAPGQVINVPAGDHAGPLVIDRPLRLRGEPGAAIVGDGESHVIEIRAPDVEVSGLLIRNSGFDLSADHAGIFVVEPRAVITGNTIVDCLHGIYVKAADNVRITHNTIRGRAEPGTINDPITTGIRLSASELCSEPLGQNARGNGIHLWKSAGHEITDNDIRGTRDGMYFSFTDRTHVARNHVEQVRYGLHYMYSDQNTFEYNTFTRNAAGSALMFSVGLELRHNRFVANRSHRAYGLLMHSVDSTIVEDNLIEGNTVGVYLESNNGNTLAGNRVAGNYIGLRVSDSSGDNVFAGNAFVRNLHPVETSGANAFNRWANGGRGNYWSGATRLDLDENGITDVPHHEVDLFGPWRRDFPEVALLSGSPGERLMRFIYSRTRVAGIPGITDPAPLVRATAP